MRREKSLRIGVHHADGVVWEPVYRTHLHLRVEPRLKREHAAHRAEVRGGVVHHRRDGEELRRRRGWDVRGVEERRAPGRVAEAAERRRIAEVARARVEGEDARARPPDAADVAARGRAARQVVHDVFERRLRPRAGVRRRRRRRLRRRRASLDVSRVPGLVSDAAERRRGRDAAARRPLRRGGGRDARRRRRATARERRGRAETPHAAQRPRAEHEWTRRREH